MSAPEPLVVVTRSAKATERLAGRLARALVPPATVLLDGDLGAGKTTFARGFVAALAGAARIVVQSPTFALARSYPTTPPVHHLDLYRLDSDSALDALGLRDLLDDPAALTLVEWPRGVEAGTRTVRVRFESRGARTRRIHVALPEAFGAVAADLT